MIPNTLKPPGKEKNRSMFCTKEVAVSHLSHTCLTLVSYLSMDDKKIVPGGVHIFDTFVHV